MARQVVEVRTCDFCGGPSPTTYAILYGSSRYEIDLDAKELKRPFSEILKKAKPVKASGRDAMVLIPKDKLIDSLKD